MPRILIVEDNLITAKLLKACLERDGHNVSVCEIAAESIQQFACGWDLVVLDLGLPGVEGLELVQKARAALPSVPIIIYSGYALEGEIAITAGANAMIVKGRDSLNDLRAAARSLLA